MAPQTSTKLTYEDYLEIPNDVVVERATRTLDLVAELTGSDVITSPILPGFQITAADVFHAHEG